MKKAICGRGIKQPKNNLDGPADDELIKELSESGDLYYSDLSLWSAWACRRPYCRRKFGHKGPCVIYISEISQLNSVERKKANTGKPFNVDKRLDGKFGNLGTFVRADL